MAKRLARNVTIYTNGSSELESQIQTELGKDPVIKLDNRPVTRLERVDSKTSEVTVHFEDGKQVTHGFMVRISSQKNVLF